MTQLIYRMGNSKYSIPKNNAIVVILFTATIIILFYSRSWIAFNFIKNAEYYRNEYNDTYPLSKPFKKGQAFYYRIALIADLDTNSRLETNSSKKQFRSYMQFGHLIWEPLKQNISWQWDKGLPLEVSSLFSYDDRGMELSELIAFNGRLYTIDDRTGIVFQIILRGKRDPYIVPWVILADGDGAQSKGFKGEWATVKDKWLYIGGLGKEWTTMDGQVINYGPMYVKRISHRGEVENLDWRRQYIALRAGADIKFPGYMIHEAAAWSSLFSRWFFLPRRSSKNMYNSVTDECMGTNVILTTDEQFQSVYLTAVGTVEPSLGFSSFKFIPETGDSIIIALKTKELEGSPTETYIMAFTSDGNKILNQPQKVPGNYKFEGIEFI